MQMQLRNLRSGLAVPGRARTPAVFRGAALLAALLPAMLAAQTPTELQQILERLDRLEKQNRELLQQVTELRQELAAARGAPETAAVSPVTKLAEQTEIQEQQIQDLAQTKVEASQRYPIRITGMALFNAYLNSLLNGGAQYSTIASLTPGSDRGGGTMRQSVIGLEYRGPTTLWGGKVHGSLYMDFFAGTGQSLDQLVHIRTGSIEVDWKSRSAMVGLEKPIFSPREPNSLAQVGISPLTGTGNLWLWVPQAKVEQRIKLGPRTQVRAQVGIMETRESLALQTTSYVPTVASGRPGLEGRFEFAHGAEGGRRIEIAPGFHVSSTHVADTSVPSSLFSVDWFMNPVSRLELTGEYWTGQNVMNLGTGAIRQGFVVLGDGFAAPVHSTGGWAQLTWLATRRLSFNFFSGQQDDRNRDLFAGRIGKNQKYGANFFYRLAPNVLASLEASQLRTTYISVGDRLYNHYDLAFAYQF
jgi:uncharacterized protein (UPF0335 family)